MSKYRERSISPLNCLLLPLLLWCSLIVDYCSYEVTQFAEDLTGLSILWVTCEEIVLNNSPKVKMFFLSLLTAIWNP
jgi:hypothetical protein